MIQLYEIVGLMFVYVMFASQGLIVTFQLFGKEDVLKGFYYLKQCKYWNGMILSLITAYATTAYFIVVLVMKNISFWDFLFLILNIIPLCFIPKYRKSIEQDLYKLRNLYGF